LSLIFLPTLTLAMDTCYKQWRSKWVASGGTRLGNASAHFCSYL